MSQYEKDLVLVALFITVSASIGFCVGYMEGRHKERMTILNILNDMKMVDHTSTTMYHILYVKNMIRNGLREAWGK